MQQEQENIGNKKKKPRISVIVPIYNVENYVRQCLDSLLHQTMKEIEVICIDDGSTDSSRKIVEEYVGPHEGVMVRVIHTENRGLSAARNRGIDVAKADWLMFVDGDDWVSPGFCREPYEAALENKADMVIFGTYHTSEGGRIKRLNRSKERSGVVRAEDVIMNSVAWNKIYKRVLFNEIRYPEGHVFEDIATTHKLIIKAKRIYRYGKKLYYYRKRKGSISFTSMNRSDLYCSKRDRYRDLVTLGYSISKAQASYQAAALSYCGQAVSSEDPLYKEATKIVEKIQGVPDEFNKKQIAKLLLWRTNRDLYREVYRMLGRRMR